MSRISQFIKARPLAVAAVGAIAIIAGATAVSAQYGPGWGGGYGWGRAGPMGQGGFDRRARFAMFCANNTARYQPVARAYVKADLNLNPAQSAEFDKLADVLMPAMEAIKAEACNNFGARTAPAPEKLEKLAGILRKAADAAEQSVAPAKTFYAQLDDQQKARVEQLTERRGGMRRGWHGGHHGGPGYGGPGGPGGPNWGPGGMPPR
jgi:hypothetical protein